MKHIIALTLSIIVGITPTILQGQTIHTTAHEAILPLQVGEHENIRIYKDTLLFEEHFEHIISDQVNISTPIGGTSCLYTLPRSLTQKPYCRAKDIKVQFDSIKNTSYCYLAKGSAFATPNMDIPAGSIINMFVKTSREAIIAINNENLSISGSTKHITHTISQRSNEVIITNINSIQINIDSITITSPRDILSPENYTLNDDTLRITNLSPSTKYHIEITDSETNEARHYTFETKKQIENPTTRIQGANTVKLAWTNNVTQTAPTLHLYEVNNATRDLLFSRIATKVSNYNYGLEIYNGTGKDISLGDYEIAFFDGGYTTAETNIEYRFSDKDTIHRDSYVMISYKLDSLDSYDFVSFPIKYSNSVLGGNDACMLLKKDLTGEYRDTIDLFGRIVPGTSTASLSYKNSILTRKANIKTGIKHNPQTTPIYFKNPASEWDSVYFKATYLNADSMKHKLEHPITYSPISTITTTPGQEEIIINNLEPRSRYHCIMTINNDTVASLGFDTGNIINSNTSGAWNNPTTWENATPPQATDKVIIKKGHKITIPNGTNSECKELVLQSDYTTPFADTNKSELTINGILKADKLTVEATFAAYTATTTGWHLIGVPIDVEGLPAKDIAHRFQRTNDDDLYYLDEPLYSWIPYSEEHHNEHFFTNTTGYLVAYKDNKTLSFEGKLYLRDTINLLKDASHTANKGQGYHVVCNPYPFTIGLNNISSNNIDGFWLLNPLTGAYTPSDNNQPTEFTVPPFGGIMTKVSTTTNTLTLHKNKIPQSKNKPAETILGKIYLTLHTEGGTDEARLYIRTDATMKYDEYDTYKLFSVGTAPDIWFSIADEDLSVAAVYNTSDSISLHLKVSDKSGKELTMTRSEKDTFFERISLCEHGTDSLLCDFITDSTYTFVCEEGRQAKEFELRLKWHSADKNPTCEEMKITQTGREVRIEQPLNIDKVELFDIEGRLSAETTGKDITLPQAGCFVLRVSRGTKVYTTKIIAL